MIGSHSRVSPWFVLLIQITQTKPVIVSQGFNCLCEVEDALVKTAEAFRGPAGSLLTNSFSQLDAARLFMSNVLLQPKPVFMVALFSLFLSFGRKLELSEKLRMRSYTEV